MPEPHIAPYGAWKSPITADLIAGQVVSLGSVLLDGEDTYWTEGRPAEAGRTVVVRRAPDGTTTDITPAPFNVRTRVHEYGGGAYAVADRTVYFSNFADNRLYRQTPGAAPEALTPSETMRYGDMIVDAARNRLIAVREDHSEAGHEAVNTLVSVSLTGDDPGTILVSGADFYSSPRLAPDGNRLAWLAWHHPNMPWDGTELWVADVQADGSLGAAALVAGGPEESIFQPEWSPDGLLYFVSDRSNWWNFYRQRDGQIEALYPMEAEFGGPQWALGTSHYAFAGPDRIVCSYEQAGTSHLALLDTTARRLEPIATPYISISQVRVSGDRAVFIGGAPDALTAIVQLDLASGATTVLKQSSSLTIDPCYLSRAEPIEFPTEGGLTAYAFYYPPQNCDYQAPAEERPPLLVMSHGGPTGATSAALRLAVQYWTSRGFAVLDVNYGGSTGYGRAYRQRLNGQWGVVDVDDCINGARYLAERGLVDPHRLAITGGSAGGYTTLCALTFRDVFQVGTSHFGLSDLTADLEHTHKFESRYSVSMIGPYPEAADLYRERSPIHYADRLQRPVLFTQGLDDKVVLPEQAEVMVEAMRRNGVPVAYLPFPGEGHGFRRAENIRRSYEAELSFYAQILGFPLAEPIDPVPIENFDPAGKS